MTRPAVRRPEPTGRRQRAEPVVFGVARCLVEDLRAGLARGELALHWQPIVDLASGRLRAAEVLVRWRHPTRGLLLPGQFLALAEESGLGVELGERVLAEALRQHSEWRRAGRSPPPVAINAGPAWLRAPALADRVRDALHAAGASPGALGIEVSVREARVRALAVSLAEVAALGVRITVDHVDTLDVPSLAALPAARFKLDIALSRGLGRDPAAEEFALALRAIALSLGRELVVPGVEDEVQAAWLRAERFPLVQGYLFGIPAELTDVGKAAGPWLAPR